MAQNKISKLFNDPNNGLNDSQKKLAMANSVKSVAENLLTPTYTYAMLVSALTDEKFNVKPTIRVATNGSIQIDFSLEVSEDDVVDLFVKPEVLTQTNVVRFNIAVGSALLRDEKANETSAIRETFKYATKYSNEMNISFSQSKDEAIRSEMFNSITNSVFAYIRANAPDLLEHVPDLTVFRTLWDDAYKAFVTGEETDINEYIKRYNYAMFDVIYGSYANTAREYYGYYNIVATSTDRVHNGGMDIRTNTDEFTTAYLMLCLAG